MFSKSTLVAIGCAKLTTPMGTNCCFQKMPNLAVKAAPSSLWTLSDKASRSAPYLQRWAS